MQLKYIQTWKSSETACNFLGDFGYFLVNCEKSKSPCSLDYCYQHWPLLMTFITP